MKLRYVSVDHSEGQKPDIFMKLIKHSLDRTLFLKKPLSQSSLAA
jgi:hypothetical protein